MCWDASPVGPVDEQQPERFRKFYSVQAKFEDGRFSLLFYAMVQVVVPGRTSYLSTYSDGLWATPHFLQTGCQCK